MKDIPETVSVRAFTNLVLEVFRFNGRLLEAGDRLTKEYGITSSLWQVLGAIHQSPLPVAQIARNMGLARQSVLRTVNALSKKGLVEALENPDHKRAKLIRITADGERVYSEVMEVQRRWAAQAMDGLDPCEAEAARKLMEKLGERL